MTQKIYHKGTETGMILECLDTPVVELTPKELDLARSKWHSYPREEEWSPLYDPVVRIISGSHMFPNQTDIYKVRKRGLKEFVVNTSAYDGVITTDLCPCGKGLSIVVHASSDWGRNESRRFLACGYCEYRYSYLSKGSEAMTSGLWGERGWVSLQQLEEEKEYRQTVLTNAKRLYFRKYQEVRDSGKTLKVRKALLTLGGAYQPTTVATYRKHGEDSYWKSLLDFRDLKQFLEVCRVEIPDWELLGVKNQDRERFQPNLEFIRQSLQDKLDRKYKGEGRTIRKIDY